MLYKLNPSFVLTAEKAVQSQLYKHCNRNKRPVLITSTWGTLSSHFVIHGSNNMKWDVIGCWGEGGRGWEGGVGGMEGREKDGDQGKKINIANFYPPPFLPPR